MRILAHYWIQSFSLPYNIFNSPVQKEIKKVIKIYDLFSVGTSDYNWSVIMHNYLQQIPINQKISWKKIISEFQKTSNYEKVQRKIDLDFVLEMNFFGFSEFLISERPNIEEDLVKLILKETNIVEITNKRFEGMPERLQITTSPKSIREIIDEYQTNLDYEDYEDYDDDGFMNAPDDIVNLCIKFPFLENYFDFSAFATFYDVPKKQGLFFEQRDKTLRKSGLHLFMSIN